MSAVKRYKCQALVKPLPEAGGKRGLMTGPSCRMVVRAHHCETSAPRLFSALVSTSADQIPGDEGHLVLTVSVLGDDAVEYLGPGCDFDLWRGCDIGHGVVTRRVFV